MESSKHILFNSFLLKALNIINIDTANIEEIKQNFEINN